MAVNKTLYMIAEAANGEEHEVTGGSGGDQIGAELRTRAWEQDSRGWSTVFRIEDPKIREKIACFMEKAILNGFIGYDQGDRNTLEDSLKKNDYNPSMIHNNCDTDCSMTVYEAVKYATGISCPLLYEVPPSKTSHSPTRDEITGLCGETFFGSRQTYPTGSNFHYYMTRVLPLHGIKVSVYTCKSNVSDENYWPGAFCNLFTTYNGTKYRICNSSGRYYTYTHPAWGVWYYDTPYEHIGITKTMINNNDSSIIPYTFTINGVTYYNEFGKAVDDFLALSRNTITGSTRNGRNIENGLCKIDQSPNSTGYTWERVKSYNALTKDQIITLGNNLNINLGTATETNEINHDYLLSSDGLLRGDILHTKGKYFSGSSHISKLDAYIKNSDGTITKIGEDVAIRYGSSGHIVVWV